jgi:hypothetical protein
MTANLSLDIIPEFNHKAPEGYYYEVEEFKRNVLSIWLCCHRQFDYNNGKSTRTIWGFFSSKKREFYSPVNSSTVGKEVKFSDTRSWTSMPINYQGLEVFFT